MTHCSLWESLSIQKNIIGVNIIENKRESFETDLFCLVFWIGFLVLSQSLVLRKLEVGPFALVNFNIHE